MKKRKWASLLLVILLSVFPLVACNTNEDGQTQDDSQNGEAGSATDAVQVDFWAAPNQEQYDFWSSKAKDFNESEENASKYEVVVQKMPETPSSEAGIQNSIVTGTVPAISENINIGFAATLADSEAIYDLQDEEWFQDIVANRDMSETLKGWEIDGKQYVIPMYVNPMLWQWNIKALNALGFENVPETMAELEDVIAAFVEQRDTTMQDMGVTHIFYRPSLQRSDQWWDRWHDFQMPYQALTQGKTWVEGNELTLDREGAIEAFEFIGRFGDGILTTELTNLWTQDNPSVLLTVNAPWEINLLREAGKEYGVDFEYGPSIVKEKGDIPYCYADAKGLVLYKNDSISEEEHQGAVEFLKYIFAEDTSAQTDLEWLDATSMLPVR